MGESRGISNRIRDNDACIRFANGKLLVIKYQNKDRFPEAV
jgi:thiamine pyrophosphokinase